MTAYSPRTFTILDAMILLAATAIAFAWSRETTSRIVLFRPIHRSSQTFREPTKAEIWQQLIKRFPLSTWVQLAVRVAIPFLVMWTATILGLSFRQPRQPVGEFSKTPGFAACLAGTMAITIDAFWITVHYLASSSSWSGLNILTTVNSVDVSFAVAGAWLMLIVLGVWTPEQSWLDRFGRFLGVAWIGLAVLFRGQEVLQLFKW
jgi:hypothetical protein